MEINLKRRETSEVPARLRGNTHFRIVANSFFWHFMLRANKTVGIYTVDIAAHTSYSERPSWGGGAEPEGHKCQPTEGFCTLQLLGLT